MRVYFAFILSFFTSILFGQNIDVQNYSVSEGLPQSQVYDITEGSNGLLWLATRGGGVASFDGNSFTNYTTADGLVHNYLNSVFSDSRGLIWIGTSNGVSLFNGIRFRTIPIPQEGKVNVSSIVEGKNNHIYFGTNKGVYLRKDRTTRNISDVIDLPSKTVQDVFVDQFNFLWIAHDHGLTSFKSGKSKHYKNKFFRRYIPQCVYQDSHKNIWVGTYGKGIAKIKANDVEFIAETDGLVVLDIVENNGVLWLSTLKNGLIIYDKLRKSVHPLKENGSLPTLNCRKVFKDSWGGCWIGTSGGGLVKLQTSLVTNINKQYKLEGDYIYAVQAGTDSSVWFTTNERKLYKFKDNKVEEFGLEQQVYPQKTKAVLQDKKGRVWLGTQGNGVWVWENGKIKQFKAGRDLGSNYVSDIIQDKRGRVWVATTNGISVFSDVLKKVNYYNTSKNNIHANRIESLWCDRSNKIWYGTRNKGIGCISTSITVLNTSNGLSDNAIRDISENNKGELVVATANGGLNFISIYNSAFSVKTLQKGQGHQFSNIYSVLIDDKDQLWIGTANGVYKLANPFKNDFKVTHFGKNEGFTGVETTKGAVTADSKGNLWWGTINGLMRLRNDSIIMVGNKPKISIKSINIFYNSIQKTAYESNILNWYVPNHLDLQYRDNHIGFDLRGIDLQKSADIKYKWRLDGGNGRWSPFINESKIYLSNLSPGKYIFQAKAVNKDGIESEQLNFHFSVITPFYFRWWFWGAIAAVVIGLVYWRIRIRIAKIKAKAIALNAQLKLEKEVLELEQKTLRLQMNPHFIFNALNAIQNLIRKQDNKSARYSLSKFSKLMREILDASRADLIPLSQEISMLEHYLSIEKITRAESFNYHIHVGEGVDVEEEGIPPMLIQPFLENAIIHGLAGDNTTGDVQLSFINDGDYLNIVIEDNGIGLTAAKQIKAQEAVQHKSVALEVIQARLNKIKGEKASQYTIEELIDENEKVMGTRVTITLKRQSIW